MVDASTVANVGGSRRTSSNQIRNSVKFAKRPKSALLENILCSSIGTLRISLNCGSFAYALEVAHDFNLFSRSQSPSIFFHSSFIFSSNSFTFYFISSLLSFASVVSVGRS